MEKPLTYDQFIDIYSKVPRVNVELIIRSEEGIILTKRSMDPCVGQWHIPGGTIYFGDTPEDAIHRIALEELGIKVRTIRLIDIITYPSMHKNGYFGWPIGIAYELEMIGGVLRGSDQGEEVAIFSKVPKNTIDEQAKFFAKHFPKMA